MGGKHCGLDRIIVHSVDENVFERDHLSTGSDKGFTGVEKLDHGIAFVDRHDFLASRVVPAMKRDCQTNLSGIIGKFQNTRNKSARGKGYVSGADTQPLGRENHVEGRQKCW